MKEEKLKAAILLGAELMIEHGLSDWKLDIVNKRTTLGSENTLVKAFNA